MTSRDKESVIRKGENQNSYLFDYPNFLPIRNDCCSAIGLRIFRTYRGNRCNSFVSFSSGPSTLKVIVLDVGVGLLADHLLLLVVRGQEAADSAALPAGVGHKLGIC